jgi:hypothetical protein
MEAHILTLSEEDYDLLLLLCGYATGAAMKEGNRALAKLFLDFANRMFAGNPHSVPYNLDVFEKTGDILAARTGRKP